VNALLFALLSALPVRAEVLVTMDEALALAFPGCAVEQRTHYLSYDQRRAAGDRAGVPVESSLVREYQGVCDGANIGSAYFDTHPVRELPATLMVVVGADGLVKRVELLSFEGPDQHRPPASFYAQVHGLGLSRELSVRRSALRPVSGATLSSRAAVDAARRVLALHEVIQAVE
jgi:hypothetical protein